MQPLTQNCNVGGNLVHGKQKVILSFKKFLYIKYGSILAKLGSGLKSNLNAIVKEKTKKNLGNNRGLLSPSWT